jgi:hypothetical protein
VSGVILQIQVPGKTGRMERFYKLECEDSRADTLRKAITAWAKKPSDYERGNKRPKPNWKAQPTVRGDDDVIPGVEVDTKVAAVFAE